MGGGASIPIPQEFIELDDEGQKAFAKEFEALTTSDTPDVVPFSPRTALDKLYRAELTRRSGADPVTTDPMVIADAVMKLAEMDAVSSNGYYSITLYCCIRQLCSSSTTTHT